MADRSRDDLDERIDELEATLEALRDELGPERGPMGLPRPPRPRAFLRFADDYAIPAMEANIRALELLQAGIRVSDRERVAGEAGRAGRAVRDRATDVGSATLDRLDRALADLESAIEGRDLPADPEARELLTEARQLNDEIRDRVAVESSAGRSEAVRIDVESELESIRDEVSAGTAEEGAAGDDEPAVSE